MVMTIATTLVGLVLIGGIRGIGAQLGGAPRGRAAARVLAGGSLAIALGIGRVIGAAVG